MKVRRALVAILFALLAWIVLSIAVQEVRSPFATQPAKWAIGALILAGCVLGIRSAWSQRPLELVAALALVWTGWLVHSIWRLSHVPEATRAVTFGGDVVQSAFAFTLFALATMWAGGVIAVNLRAPPRPAARP